MAGIALFLQFTEHHDATAKTMNCQYFLALIANRPGYVALPLAHSWTLGNRM